jgi:S1-C subfamily serine protease
VAQRGRIPRAYLGVGTQPVGLPEALRERLGLEQQTAVIVVNVRADSPAGQAGLMLGDVVVAIDGDAITEPEDLAAALRPERVGQAVTVRIVRGGEPREVRVTVGERPPRA